MHQGLPMSATELDPAVIDAAAVWFVTLSSGVVSTEERADFDRWYAAHANHARAWARFESIQKTLTSASATAPVVAASTLRTTHRRLLDRRRILKGLAALGAVIPAAYLLHERDSLSQVLADLHTGIGERRQFTLADGSQIWLNTDSAVDVHFDAGERRVLLRRGEIQIATARDVTGRPFVVTTADGSLRPVGTRFIVRRYNDEARTQLQVNEGAVDVSLRDASKTFRVSAGQSMQFSAARASQVGIAGNDDAWVDGLLGAERMRLGDFVAELARHRRGILRCDPAVADLRLTGSFPLADTDRVLAKLAQTLPVSVTYRTRYWVTVVSR